MSVLPVKQCLSHTAQPCEIKKKKSTVFVSCKFAFQSSAKAHMRLSLRCSTARKLLPWKHKERVFAWKRLILEDKRGLLSRIYSSYVSKDSSLVMNRHQEYLVLCKVSVWLSADRSDSLVYFLSAALALATILVVLLAFSVYKLQRRNSQSAGNC